MFKSKHSGWTWDLKRTPFVKAPRQVFDSDGNSNYTAVLTDPYGESYNWRDTEGNIWDSRPESLEDGSYTEPKLLISSEVTNDPYINVSGLVYNNPIQATELYNLKQSNPTEYYKQAASLLEDKIFADWSINNTNSTTNQARDLLEGIKQYDPQSYYTAKLTDLGRNVGWQIGQNRNDRNAPTIEQIKALIPEAQAAGLTPDQIQSIVGNSVNTANMMNQQRIVNEQSAGNGSFWQENLPGIGFVAASALGAYGIDAALEAGAAAGSAGAGGGAFVPAAGSGASFVIPEGAAYTTGALSAGGAEAGASQFTPEIIQYANASADPIGTLANLQGLTPEEFASVTQYIGGPSTAQGFTAGQDLTQLMQSYPDLSSTQLEDILRINYGTDPMLSADAANLAANGYDAATIDQVLGYSYTPTELAGTGIESVAADSASGLNAKDVLKNLSRAKQLANLLGGSTGSMIKAAKMPTQQQWQTQAAQNFATAPQEQFGGLYEMNKSPFTFQNPMASALAGGKQPNVYDVSGTQGTALNTAQQNKIYSSLLRS